MKHTRTLAALVWLVTASSMPGLPAQETIHALTVPQHRTSHLDRASSAVPRTQEPWAADYPATVEIDGATVYASGPGVVDDVRWALERFATAGFDLPHVEVWMHTEPWGCQGPDGDQKAAYYARRTGIHVIFSCRTRFTLLHELAHVWDHHTLTDDIREAFLVERRLEVWRGAEWRKCGAEHLANIIAWGLDDRHTRPKSTAPSDDASLLRAFAIATGGAEPPE